MNPFLLRRLSLDVPLIHPAALAAQLHAEPLAAEHPYFKKIRDNVKPASTYTDDGLAIVPVEGTLARKPDVWELAYGSVEDSSAILDLVESAAKDGGVRGILLNVDSPGGYVTGGPEIAEAVKDASRQKPVITWTGGMACSLAYWIASQSHEIIGSRSAIVGSVGVFASHLDYTKYLEDIGIKVEVIKNTEGTFKAAGAFGISLTDDQRDNIQADVQTIFGSFKRAVKTARPQIEDDSLRGQTMSGTQAKSAGLIDRIGNRAYALSVLRHAVRSA